MKLKLDDAGQAVLQDGKPLYVKEDGSEIAFDAKQAFDKIGELTGQATGFRKERDSLKDSLAKFGDIDPEKAQEALTTLSNLDAKKLVDAGEVEKVKEEVAKSFEPIKAENESLKGKINSLVVDNAFNGSQFIKDKLAIPADFAKAYFGQHFSVEDGALVPKDASGNTIYSPSKPGEIASFDEALSVMANSHPAKDAILKGTGSNGSGADAGKGQQQGKQATRSQFDAMSQPERAEFSKEGGKVVDG